VNGELGINERVIVIFRRIFMTDDVDLFLVFGEEFMFGVVMRDNFVN
jgi:hypothetical protein